MTTTPIIRFAPISALFGKKTVVFGNSDYVIKRFDADGEQYFFLYRKIFGFHVPTGAWSNAIYPLMDLVGYSTEFGEE